jgi:hypothetical protein
MYLERLYSKRIKEFQVHNLVTMRRAQVPPVRQVQQPIRLVNAEAVMWAKE